MYKFRCVGEEVRIKHEFSHHHTRHFHNSCSLCSHYGLVKKCTIDGAPVYFCGGESACGMAMDMGMTMLLLLKETAKCARLFLPLLLLLLSGDIELNPGPPPRKYVYM